MLYQEEGFFFFSFKNLILGDFHFFVHNIFLIEGLGFSEHKAKSYRDHEHKEEN